MPTGRRMRKFAFATHSLLINWKSRSGLAKNRPLTLGRRRGGKSYEPIRTMPDDNGANLQVVKTVAPGLPTTGTISLKLTRLGHCRWFSYRRRAALRTPLKLLDFRNMSMVGVPCMLSVSDTMNPTTSVPSPEFPPRARDDL